MIKPRSQNYFCVKFLDKFLLYFSFLSKSLSSLVLIRVISSKFSVADIVALNNFYNILALLMPLSIFYLQNYLYSNFRKLIKNPFPFTVLRNFWFFCVIISGLLFIAGVFTDVNLLFVAGTVSFMALLGICTVTNCYLVYRKRFREINTYLLLGSLASLALTIITAITGHIFWAFGAVCLPYIAPIWALVVSRRTRKQVIFFLSLGTRSADFSWPLKSSLITMLSMSLHPLVVIGSRQIMVSKFSDVELYSWEIYYRLSSFILLFFTQPMVTLLAKSIGEMGDSIPVKTFLYRNRFILIFPCLIVLVIFLQQTVVFTVLNIKSEVLVANWFKLMVAEITRVYSWLISFVFLMRASVKYYLISEVSANFLFVIIVIMAHDIQTLLPWYSASACMLLILNLFLFHSYKKSRVLSS